MRHNVLQVHFSHDLHPPADPWIKEIASFFHVFVSVADCC